MSLKIGDVLWHFDPDRRVYTKRERGWGEIIWREHWRPWIIIDETKLSWITSRGPGEVRPRRRIHWDQKVSKKKIVSGLVEDWVASEQEVEERVWAHENVYRISREVERIKNPSLLRQVAALIGYKESE